MKIEIPEHVQNTIADRVKRIAACWFATSQHEEIERAMLETWAEGYMAGRRQGDDEP